MMKENDTLGFIGCGNMGAALARGMAAARLLPAGHIRLADADGAKARLLAEEIGAVLCGSNAEVLDRSDTVLLAVKPQGMAGALDEIAPFAGERHLFISIAAGVSLRMMEKRLGSGARVIRAMPNTPATIGCGVAALSRGSAARAADMETALAVFQAVGVAVEVEENQLDAVTGLSGSGPAYVFRMMEALERAGEKNGLPPAIAACLARQTVLGAARMAAETGIEPAELRRRVTSPQGTTEAGLQMLDAGGFEELMERVVRRAAERSRELAGLFDA